MAISLSFDLSRAKARDSSRAERGLADGVGLPGHSFDSAHGYDPISSVEFGNE